MTLSRQNRSTRRGFSLVEMITVVAILGVATSMAVMKIGRVSDGTKLTVATDITEKLNQGVRQFSQVNWDMTFNANPLSGGDEILVLRSLQYRDPDEPAHGSPYFRTNWNPSTSSSAEDYRIEWTGSAWQLLEPGTDGAGIKVVFDGSDLTTPFVFPAVFTPVGSR